MLFDSESVIKTKIHSFRTQFTKEKNMIENSKKNGAAPEDIYIPKYEFFQYLLFLEPVIIKRATRPNLVRIFLIYFYFPVKKEIKNK